MKRIIIVFILVIIILSCNGIALAEDSIYELDEMNMTITIPVEFIVLTRDIKDDDPNLLVYYTDKETLLNVYENSHIYLSGRNDYDSIKIDITMIENDDISYIFDFSTYTINEIDGFAQKMLGMETQEIIDIANEAGQVDMSDVSEVSFDKYFITKYDQVFFIVSDTYNVYDDITIYVRQYSTIINGQGINITMQSTNKELSNDNIMLLDSIINSIEFSEIKEKPIIEKKIEIPKAIVAIEETESDIVFLQDEASPLASEKTQLNSNTIFAIVIIALLTIMLLIMIVSLILRLRPQKSHAFGHSRRHTRRRY